MPTRTVIASAGNLLPAALSSLRALGFTVSIADNGRLCKAESATCTFVAEDPLLLLGIVKLHEVRGPKWAPTDSEVEAYLAFDAPQSGSSDGERADVWEDHGSVHVLCVTDWGDPVEFGVAEAQAFAARLGEAISKAE